MTKMNIYKKTFVTEPKYKTTLTLQPECPELFQDYNTVRSENIIIVF